MEPQPQLSNHKSIKVELQAGQFNIAPDILNLNLQMTYNKSKIALIRDEFAKKGLTPDLLENNFLIIEFNCHPGSENLLIEEFQNIQNQKEEPQSNFRSLLRQLIQEQIQIKCIGFANKVYLYFKIEQSQSLQQYTKYIDFNTQVNVHLVVQGHKNLNNNEEKNASIDLDFVSLKFQYQQSKNLGTFLKNFLDQNDKQSIMVRSLPQLKKADIKLKFNSLRKMSQLIKFEVSESGEEGLSLFTNQNIQITNQLGVYLVNRQKFLLKSNLELNHLNFILNRYIRKAITYLGF